MNDEEHKKEIDKEFDKLAKNAFPDPAKCNELNETRAYISQLNEVIAHFQRKFNYIPSSAHLLFDRYNSQQEKILFEQYLNEYGNRDKSRKNQE